MSFYEFKVEDAERFAREHGGEAKHKGKELVFKYCPFCRGGKKPDKYTFAINLETGRFNCQRGSCGRKGNMITLSQEFDFELSGAASHYYNFTDSNMNTPNGSFRRFKDAHKQIISKDGAVQYMKSRGISEEVCRKYEITIHDKDKQRIVFPFKDEDGKIQFVKYRNTDPERIAKGSKEFCEPNCMPILFGMNHCQDYERLVITEGQIDSLSVTEAGVPNAVSVPTGKNGFTWVPHCWDFVKKFKEIVQSCAKARKYLDEKLWPQYKEYAALAEYVSGGDLSYERYKKLVDYQYYTGDEDKRFQGQDKRWEKMAENFLMVYRLCKKYGYGYFDDIENEIYNNMKESN